MVFNCYQCNKVAYLFADSRCNVCTRTGPETESDDQNQHLHAEQSEAIGASTTPD